MPAELLALLIVGVLGPLRQRSPEARQTLGILRCLVRAIRATLTGPSTWRTPAAWNQYARPQVLRRGKRPDSVEAEVTEAIAGASRGSSREDLLIDLAQTALELTRKLDDQDRQLGELGARLTDLERRREPAAASEPGKSEGLGRDEILARRAEKDRARRAARLKADNETEDGPSPPEERRG